MEPLTLGDESTFCCEAEAMAASVTTALQSSLYSAQPRCLYSLSDASNPPLLSLPRRGLPEQTTEKEEQDSEGR